MGRKIFVSYKYADGNVYTVPYISDYQPKVRDYVTWLEKKFIDRTEHIYKGEHDNEDLSDKSDEYIWANLKDKIYDSTITIKRHISGIDHSGFHGKLHILLEKLLETIILAMQMLFWE